MSQISMTSLQCLALQGGPLQLYAVPLFLIGAYFLIDGICAVIAGVKLRSAYKRGWLLIAEGVLRVIFLLGFAFLGSFGLLALMLVVIGTIEIVAAIQLRKYVNGIGFFVCAGIASVLFLPFAITSMSLRLALGFPNLFGGYAAIFGALLLAFGLTMKARGSSPVQK
jgi:uncharacterized membrane protein HdeD (DUF308 family)